jgi:hypothetical protein
MPQTDRPGALCYIPLDSDIARQLTFSLIHEVRAAMSEATTSCIGGYDGPLDGLHVVEIALPRYARFF